MQPLHSKRILVTRASDQSETLLALLRQQGAIPVVLPTIQVVAVPTNKTVLQAVTPLSSYDWLIFTSANGVQFFWSHLDPATFAAERGNLQIATIGPATAAALQQFGLTADFVPTEHLAETLAHTLPVTVGQSVLFPTGNLTQPILATELAQRGVTVEQLIVYVTQPAPTPSNLAERIANIDVFTFTSSSTVQNFSKMLKQSDYSAASLAGLVACIGPKTAQTAQGCGFVVDIVASKHTTAGLVAAVTQFYTQHPAGKE